MKHYVLLTTSLVTRLNGKPFFDTKLDPNKKEYDFVSFLYSGRDPEFTQDVLNRHAIAVKKLPESISGFVATSIAAIMSFQRLFFLSPPLKRDKNGDLKLRMSFQGQFYKGQVSVHA